MRDELLAINREQPVGSAAHRSGGRHRIPVFHASIVGGASPLPDIKSGDMKHREITAIAVSGLTATGVYDDGRLTRSPKPLVETNAPSVRDDCYARQQTRSALRADSASIGRYI